MTSPTGCRPGSEQHWCWKLSAAVLILAVAAWLRLTDLSHRPMHCDEAVQAVKFGELLRSGRWVYNPHEYHGPALAYFTLPMAWAAGASTLPELTETHLRLVPALFGLALVGLTWLLRRELGMAATTWAALLAAVSPAMVFYGRYYIQEMLLVTFTFGATVALWRWLRLAAEYPGGANRPRTEWLWLIGLGSCLGLMHASKETCVIAWFAMAVAAAVTLLITPRLRAAVVPMRAVVIRAIAVFVVGAVVSAAFFSAFGRNPAGVVDSYTTFLSYLHRAGGEGSAGPHDHPWHTYLRWLFWWSPGERLWTEAAIALSALIGVATGVAGCRWRFADAGPSPSPSPERKADLGLALIRFLSVYVLVMIVVYSAIAYKTPWCALGMLHGLILLAGIGAAALFQAMPGRVLLIPAQPKSAARTELALRRGRIPAPAPLNSPCAMQWVVKGIVLVILLAAVAHLTWQAHRASVTAAAAEDSPYVYAHTTEDVARLARRVRRIARTTSDGLQTHVQVICADADYWPLPWYLRDMPHVGWFAATPDGPPAPIIIIQPSMEDTLLHYLFEAQPPGKRHLYMPVMPDVAPDVQTGEASKDSGPPSWQLRPHVPLRLYIRHDLLNR